MHAYTHINPLEFRKEKKELTFKSQESMNCQHRTDDMVASSNSDVTGESVWEPDGNRLVARKHLVTREQLSSFAPKSFKQLLMLVIGLLTICCYSLQQ